MASFPAPRMSPPRAKRPDAATEPASPEGSRASRAASVDTLVAPAPARRDEPGVEALLEKVFLTPRVVDQRAFDEFSGSLRALVRDAAVQNKALATTTVEVKALSEQLRGASRELQTHLQAAAKSPAKPGAKPAIDPDHLEALVAKRVAETVQQAVDAAVDAALQRVLRPAVDECVHATLTNTTDQMLLALRADDEARDARTVEAAKTAAAEVAREAAQDGLTTALIGLPPGPDLAAIHQAEERVVATLERVLKAQQLLAESAEAVEARLATVAAWSDASSEHHQPAKAAIESGIEDIETRLAGAAARVAELGATTLGLQQTLEHAADACVQRTNARLNEAGEAVERRVAGAVSRADELLTRAASAQAAIDAAADSGVLRVASLAEQTQAAAARVEALLGAFDEGVRASEVRAGAAAASLEERMSQASQQAGEVQQAASECATRLGAAITELERRANTISTGLEATLADFARREQELLTHHEEKTLNTTFAAASQMEQAADEFGGKLAGLRDMHERAAKAATQDAANRLDAAVADFARRLRELDVRAINDAIGLAGKAGDEVLEAARRAQACAVGAGDAAARCEAILAQTESARSQLSQTLINGANAADALAARVDKAQADHQAWVATATTPLTQATESIAQLEQLLPNARRVGDGLARLVSQADAVGEGLDKLMRKAAGKGGHSKP